jgi:hypothetical protein
MSREEAYEMMEAGHKITHQYFSRNEYYMLNGRRVRAEDGVDHTRIFWSEDQNNWRADGWEIYKEA